jgi:hypothetical protein
MTIYEDFLTSFRDRMTSFFSASLESIKEGLLATYEQGKTCVSRLLYGVFDAHHVIQRVVLVGGLASSPYVYRQLLNWGEKHGMSISRPDGPM